MGSKEMKDKKRIIISILTLALILLAWNFYENGDSKIIWGNKRVEYLKVIDKVFRYDFSGMAVVISKSSNLHGRDSESYYISTGSKENNFSANTDDGNRLSSAKELFLNLKNMKVIKEGITDTFNIAENNYYLVQINLDYFGKKRTDVYYLDAFVNSENYHIYIPKDYCEPIQLLNNSVIFVEYEPDTGTKELIDNIIKLK